MIGSGASRFDSPHQVGTRSHSRPKAGPGVPTEIGPSKNFAPFGKWRRGGRPTQSVSLAARVCGQKANDFLRWTWAYVHPLESAWNDTYYFILN